MSRTAHLGWMLSLLVVSSPRAAGPPRFAVGRKGDPLPPGAVARFNSARRRLTDRPSLAVSRDGKLIATGERGVVRFWCPRSGRLLGCCLFDRPADFWQLAFSPDGKRLAVVSSLDGPLARMTSVYLIDTAEARVLRRLGTNSDGWDGLGFCLGGAAVVSRQGLNTVVGWDCATGKQLFALPDVVEYTCSTDGQFLAVGDKQGRVRVYDREFDKPRLETTAKDEVAALAFSPDGNRLAVSTGPRLRIPNRVNAFDPKRFIKGIEGPTRDKEGPAAKREPERERTADGWVVPKEMSLRIWGLRTGKVAECLEGSRGVVKSLKFSGDGRFLLGHDDLKKALLWERGKQRAKHTFALQEHVMVAFSPDGSSLAAVEGEALWLWGLRDGAIQLLRDGRRRLPPGQGLFRKAWFVSSGRILFYAGGLETIDASSGKPLWSLGKKAGPVEALAFSADGASVRAAEASPHSWANRWALRRYAKAPLLHLADQFGLVGPLERARVDLGRNVAVFLKEDNSAALFDLATGAPIRAFRCPELSGRSLLFDNLRFQDAHPAFLLWHAEKVETDGPFHVIDPETGRRFSLP